MVFAGYVSVKFYNVYVCCLDSCMTVSESLEQDPWTHEQDKICGQYAFRIKKKKKKKAAFRTLFKRDSFISLGLVGRDVVNERLF